MEQEIRLKPMSPEMYHEYFEEYQNDPDLYIDPAKCTPFVYDEAQVDRYIRRQIDLNRKTFAIMYGEAMVGEVVIKNIADHQCATMGIAMRNAQCKDRGYGTQAEKLAIEYVFDVLDIPVLYADTLITNTRSRHVLEKVGFRFIKEDADFRYYRADRPAECCGELK